MPPRGHTLPPHADAGTCKLPFRCPGRSPPCLPPGCATPRARVARTAAAALDVLRDAQPLSLHDWAGQQERHEGSGGAAPPTQADFGAVAEAWRQQGALAGCEPGGPRLRVALLLSGGVDSSLALRLLQAAGHTVAAFYLQIWFEEDFRNSWDACPWEADLDVARRVCGAAGVPLEVVPLTGEYWQRVVQHCLGETRAGRTPNPDVLCNSRRAPARRRFCPPAWRIVWSREAALLVGVEHCLAAVKFGAFYDYLEVRHPGAFDRVASGHYARLLRPGGGAPAQLALTRDAVKDQTYFLAGLSRPQLDRAMFPLGPLTKAEVRRLAAEAGLPNQARPDSQGICFLGKVRFDEFLRAHLGVWAGPLVEAESGRVLGLHDGFWFFTPGQRRGIGLAGGPWYVARKDAAANAVYVSRAYYSADKRRDAFLAGQLNWLAPGPPSLHGPLQCKVRHGPRAYACAAAPEPGGRLRVTLQGDDQGLAAGQVAVFYRDGLCLGSATILEALDAPPRPAPSAACAPDAAPLPVSA